MRSSSLHLSALHNGVDASSFALLLRQFRRYQFTNLEVASHDCNRHESRMRRCVASADVILIDVGLAEHDSLWRYLRAHMDKPCALWTDALDQTTVKHIETLGLRHRSTLVITAKTLPHSLPRKSRVFSAATEEGAYRAAIAIRNLFPHRDFTPTTCPC